MLIITLIGELEIAVTLIMKIECKVVLLATVWATDWHVNIPTNLWAGKNSR